MALPSWIQRTRSGVVSSPSFAAAGGGAGAPTHQLVFAMETQSATNWCWAAVSVSVAHYLSPSPVWRQCDVASQELAKTCCPIPTPNPCDTTWFLEKALKRVGHLSTWAGGHLNAASIRTELASNQPVGCRIGWFGAGGGGHFVVISGIKPNGATDDVTIEDPLYGQSIIPLATFQTSYRSSGSWTHTYYTN